MKCQSDHLRLSDWLSTVADPRRKGSALKTPLSVFSFQVQSVKKTRQKLPNVKTNFHFRKFFDHLLFSDNFDSSETLN